MLSESYELNRKFCHEPQSHPFPQPHNFPFAVRHNLLFAKKSALSSYKAAYPFVLRLEFAAVQIIAVDSLQNSDFCKAGYIMNTGNLSKNNVSTGDLNRGRRACRLLETWSPCSHPFAILPVSAVSDAQKLATGNFLCVRARAFCVTFCTPQKVTSRLPCREFRGFANLESTRTGGGVAQTN